MPWFVFLRTNSLNLKDLMSSFKLYQHKVVREDTNHGGDALVCVFTNHWVGTMAIDTNNKRPFKMHHEYNFTNFNRNHSTIKLK